jgi:hypothetical protein
MRRSPTAVLGLLIPFDLPGLASASASIRRRDRLPVSVASRRRLERLLELPSRRVGPGRFFIGRTSTSQLAPLRNGQIGVDDLASLCDPGGEPQVPQLRCVIRAGGRQKLAIGTERHVLHRVVVTDEWPPVGLPAVTRVAPADQVDRAHAVLEQAARARLMRDGQSQKRSAEHARSAGVFRGGSGAGGARS